MKVSISRFRSGIDNLLDHVAESGEAIELERKGKQLRLVAVKPVSRLVRLKKPRQKVWIGDRRDIFKIDWLTEWRKEWKVKG